MVKELPVNHRIRAKEVLLIGADGGRVGVLPLQAALQKAREEGLDLVEVSSNTTPPVCRLLDYGKYRYQQTKKEREARKSQKTALLREIRIRPKIGDHDLDSKVRLVKRLLGEGDKVRVTITFRGREITHPERGRDVFRRMLEQLKDVALVEQPQLEDRKLSLTFSPPKQAKKIEKEETALEVSDAKA